MGHIWILPVSQWCTGLPQAFSQMAYDQLLSAQLEVCTSPLWATASETVYRCFNKSNALVSKKKEEKKAKNTSYHFQLKNISREVGALFHVPDDCRLNPLSSTLHHQTWRDHRCQLVGLHVAQTPCQNLYKSQKIKKNTSDNFSDQFFLQSCCRTGCSYKWFQLIREAKPSFLM